MLHSAGQCRAVLDSVGHCSSKAFSAQPIGQKVVFLPCFLIAKHRVYSLMCHTVK